MGTHSSANTSPVQCYLNTKIPYSKLQSSPLHISQSKRDILILLHHLLHSSPFENGKGGRPQVRMLTSSNCFVLNLHTWVSLYGLSKYQIVFGQPKCHVTFLSQIKLQKALILLSFCKIKEQYHQVSHGEGWGLRSAITVFCIIWMAPKDLFLMDELHNLVAKLRKRSYQLMNKDQLRLRDRSPYNEVQVY